MSEAVLLKWKAQIFEYQQKVRETSPPKQATLFDLERAHCGLDAIARVLVDLPSVGCSSEATLDPKFSATRARFLQSLSVKSRNC